MPLLYAPIVCQSDGNNSFGPEMIPSSSESSDQPEPIRIVREHLAYSEKKSAFQRLHFRNIRAAALGRKVPCDSEGLVANSASQINVMQTLVLNPIRR